MKLTLYTLAALLPLSACTDTGSDRLTSDSAATDDAMMATPYAPANEPVGDMPPGVGTTGSDPKLADSAAVPPAGLSTAPPTDRAGKGEPSGNTADTAAAAPPR